MVRAELIMLKKAINCGEYAYYHFISGVDFPLVNVNEILMFFDNAGQKQLISIDNCNMPIRFEERIKFYHFFSDWGDIRKNKALQILERISLKIQRVLRIDRINSLFVVGIGSAYFSITDEFARYIVEKESWIRKHFCFTIAADEMFIQVLWLNWKNDNEQSRFHSQREDHPYIQRPYLDVKRAIDWVRGIPYVYRLEDFSMLRNSGCLFARKFDYERFPEIIDKIYEKIME